MSVRGAVVLACILYLLPIVAVLVARASKTMPLWKVALAIPAVVAFDMLGVMLAARFLRLETAILLSRPAWCALAIALAVRRWKKTRELPAWPTALRPSFVAAALAAGAGAFWVSAQLSRPYHLWDRHWHVPLVSLIRAERLPFDNVFTPGQALHYHITGDVLGAVFQTLSMTVMNASLSLSVAHDVMFALIAATAALLMFAFGMRRPWPAVLGGIALVLQGPLSMRGKLGSDFYGYSFDSLLIAGFRPHVTLAGLLITGLVGCALLRLARTPGLTTSRSLPFMTACCGVLAVTDEASVGILGLALAGTWLFAPRVITDRRLTGVAAFIGLGVALVAANLLFSGSASPGGPVQAVKWIAEARSPGTQSMQPLALSTEPGKLALFFDLLPTLTCAAGFAVAALARPMALGALAFVALVLVVSLVLMTHVEVNKSHFEAQRFLIAPCFVAIVCGLAYVSRVPAWSFAPMAVLLGLGMSSFSTLSWLRQRSTEYSNEAAEHQTPNWHEMNCRTDAGARLGEPAVLVYSDLAVYGGYVGCHPSHAAGIFDPEWGVKIFPMLDAPLELRQLETEMLRPDEDLVAACPLPPAGDAVCREAQARGLCKPEGKALYRCVLSPDVRKALLEKK